MKRIIAVLLVVSFLLSGCAINEAETSTDESTTQSVSDNDKKTEVENMNFSGLEDERLSSYVEEELYSTLEYELGEEYEIEELSSVYISKEYLEELDYNSQENVYFGYTLSELANMFQSEKYLFYLGESGKTEVKPFETYDNSIEKQLIKDVAIGTGVIVFCITVAAIAPTASYTNIIFATSAKTATSFALSSAAMSATISAIVNGIEGNNFEDTMKNIAIDSASGFKCGAIIGAVSGGAAGAISTKAKNFRSSRMTSNERGKAAEERALSLYKGKGQVAYKDGQEVSYTLANSTRPDVVVEKADGTIEAIEVKSYDLNNSTSKNTLYEELRRQVSSRVENLPNGSTQRIVLDTTGLDISDATIIEVENNIANKLSNIYPNIPIDVIKNGVLVAA